eukprot:Tamp_12203.p1 GENE.Tamp_12203~~Tamp_12203.p1  ORF type:complete len:414 (+),score=43.55 Tamp_12203:294-1535(+)
MPGRVFCHECWLSLHAHAAPAMAMCGKCARPCSGQTIEMGASTYHTACVQCFFCSTSMQSWLAQAGVGGVEGWRRHDGGSVCPQCYLRELVPLCAKCSLPTEDGVESGGRHWHTACLVCSTCATSLVTNASSFRFRESQAICEECFVRTYLPKCADPKCRKPVEEGVKALGQSWHKECFKCTTCHVLLQNATFRHNEDKAYCEACYLHEFAPKCYACKQACTETVTTAAFPDRTWHPGCFVCVQCKTLLKEGFFNKGDALYCKTCHALKFLPRCAACTEPIQGSVITTPSAKYHQACFTCLLCKAEIGVGKYHAPPKRPASSNNPEAVAIAQAAMRAEAAAEPNVVCVACYQNHFLPMCGGCKKGIKELTWHVYQVSFFLLPCLPGLLSFFFWHVYQVSFPPRVASNSPPRGI